ncbi:DCC1-like thiol-disulfide oxidoreductase family protein [Micromonospora sonneratiae]|uniref:Thiol-disulfide oxidoreductase DCC family protein n=1 Tax=Micromonospora sonneratiae TaxID=1184706 RepID=A0ABW3YMB6_9ACTN
MTFSDADPSAHGAAGIGSLTVLYDRHCPLCRTARRWLESRAQLVPLVFVPAGSTQARQQFPGLDHDATLRDITVVADTGEIYVGDGAWLACLWALADYRATADRLASPHLLPAARRMIAAASAVRQRSRDPGYGDSDDRAECADDRCGPADDGTW